MITAIRQTAAIAAVASVLIAGGSASAVEMLKKEPPDGALKSGQRVLVDDGSCPRGKVKEVIGGSNLRDGSGRGSKRRRHCIDRPS
jgi:hypothetical protein